MVPINNCENDLTGADFDELDPNVSSDVLGRARGATTSGSLYSYIDQTRSYSLNTDPPPLGLPKIVRPHHTRNLVSVDESLFSLDGTDPEVIVHIAFSELVRVRSILINTGRGEEAPRSSRVWTNRHGGIGFSDTSILKPDQEWELSESDEAVEYSTRVSRFQSITSLTFHFQAPSGGDKCRIHFLGVLGEVKQLRRDPTTQLGVGAENSADASIDSIREQMGNSQTTIR
ncbi:PITH domain-containing protein [Phakopsora pachyrhizi]|uniref:PITH domain-domain-containing protein n=1 Tax=Phakopsora pachyrhizi TaxID=170000 RepID=A0AAV0AZZ1_PHAPC|nr:PITH domain-containing protein [Phakopsora pachyrhizi]CAH7675254.1 PITH domain-domain-containing protein [Phakopsora pachyrhizi]